MRSLLKQVPMPNPTAYQQGSRAQRPSVSSSLIPSDVENHHRREHDGGAPFDYYKSVTGFARSSLPPPQRAPQPRLAWSPVAAPYFNDATQLRGSTIEASYRGQANWCLPEAGQGAFTFTASGAGAGLVIGLSSWNDSDTSGYYVVLDDDDHDTYVLKPVSLGVSRLRDSAARRHGGAMPLGASRRYQRATGVTADTSFRLRPSVQQAFWVVYSQGTISVGTGLVPGAGALIIHMRAQPNRDHLHGNDMYRFGFARLGTRYPAPVLIDNIQAHRYTLGPIAPLPSTARLIQTNLLGGDAGQQLPSSSPLFRGTSMDFERRMRQW